MFLACRKLLNPTEYIKSNSGMMIKSHFFGVQNEEYLPWFQDSNRKNVHTYCEEV